MLLPHNLFGKSKIIPRKILGGVGSYILIPLTIVAFFIFFGFYPNFFNHSSGAVGVLRCNPCACNQRMELYLFFLGCGLLMIINFSSFLVECPGPGLVSPIYYSIASISWFPFFLASPFSIEVFKNYILNERRLFSGLKNVGVIIFLFIFLILIL
jgi:hypothetical protein